jgi:GT2 family glycosyltransferase
MASRDFIETVGLMDERYFLYSEEQDWAYSAKGQFDFAYAPDAVLYHKEGATTGFSSRKTNLRSLYHLTRSRVLLTAKHAPWALPTVCASIVFAALRMAWRRVVAA